MGRVTLSDGPAGLRIGIEVRGLAPGRNIVRIGARGTCAAAADAGAKIGAPIAVRADTTGRLRAEVTGADLTLDDVRGRAMTIWTEAGRTGTAADEAWRACAVIP